MKTNGGVEAENVLVLTNCVIIHQIVLMDQVKSTQYKKLSPNALGFTYQKLKSCKPLENTKQKTSNAKSIGEN